MTEDELNERLAWSDAAGEHSALSDAAALVMRHAGEAFMTGKDTEAQTLRRVGNELREMCKAASTRLDKHIAAGLERRKQAEDRMPRAPDRLRPHHEHDEADGSIPRGISSDIEP